LSLLFDLRAAQCPETFTYVIKRVLYDIPLSVRSCEPRECWMTIRYQATFQNSGLWLRYTAERSSGAVQGIRDGQTGGSWPMGESKPQPRLPARPVLPDLHKGRVKLQTPSQGQVNFLSRDIPFGALCLFGAVPASSSTAHVTSSGNQVLCCRVANFVLCTRYCIRYKRLSVSL
jgi:hypothetical protein